MPKRNYIAISKQNGSEKRVSEKYIRKVLTGNYKNVDMAIDTLNDLGKISTCFQIFKRIKRENVSC